MWFFCFFSFHSLGAFSVPGFSLRAQRGTPCFLALWKGHSDPSMGCHLELVSMGVLWSGVVKPDQGFKAGFLEEVMPELKLVGVHGVSGHLPRRSLVSGPGATGSPRKILSRRDSVRAALWKAPSGWKKRRSL